MRLKFLVLTLVIFSCNYAYCQQSEDVEIIIMKAEEALKDNQLEKAINYGDKVITLLKGKKEENSILKVAKAQNIIGLSYFKKAQFDSLQKYADLTVKILHAPKYSKHLELAKAYHNLGVYFMEVKYHKKAIDFYNKSLSIKLKSLGVDHQETILTRINLAIIHSKKRDYDKALTIYFKILTTYEKKLKKDDVKLGKLYANIASAFYRKQEYFRAKKYYTKAVNIYEKSDPDNVYLNRIYRGKAAALQKIGNYDESLLCREKSLKISLRKSGTNSLEIAKSYKSLAIYYLRNESYEQALNYLKKTLEIEYERIPNSLSIAKTYRLFGSISHYFADYKTALEYFEKAHYILKQRNNELEIAKLYAYMSATYREFGNHEKALFLLHEALSIKKKIFKDDDLQVINGYYLLANFYISNEEYSKGIEIQKEILKKKITKFKNKSNTSILNTKFSIAYAYYKSEEYDLALSYLKDIKAQTEELPNNNSRTKALQLISDIYLKKGDLNQAKYFFEMIPIEGGIDSFFEKNRKGALYYLSNKSRLYWALHEKSQNPSLLDSIEQNLNKFLELKSKIEYNEVSEVSKEQLDYAHGVYASGVYFYYNHKKQNESKNRIFELIEKSKANRLRESINMTGFERMNLLPEDILRKKNELDTDITYLEKKVYNLKKSNDSIFLYYSNELLNLKNKRTSLLDSIKIGYPKYYNLIYNNEVTSIEKIQNKLKKDYSVLEYLVGDKHMYLLLITKNSCVVKHIKIDFPLEDWVSNMRNGIYNYWALPNSSDNFQKYNTQYQNAAYNLYDKLIRPIENELTQNVIIIPDKSLNLIPFDALLTQESFGEENNSFLIKKHNISYNYSATVFDKISDDNSGEASKEILAFAPYFPDSKNDIRTIESIRNGFGKLKHNEEEVKILENFFNVDSYYNKEATKQNFLEKLNDYKIIHISSHAKANDDNGDYSFIVFSPEKDSISEDDKLYVKDIYNKNLSAEMIVLSACETGLGELKNGEGVVSLARAFTYAGAKSTITSLWNVNDAKTTVLMKLFYMNLKKGMSKDKALYEAKLTYINTENLNAPYFWAGFIASGDVITPISTTKFDYFWIYIISIIIMLILLFKKRLFRYRN